MPLNEREWLRHKGGSCFILTAWIKQMAQRWNMKFSLPKYKVMHVARMKDSAQHSLNGTELATIRKKNMEFTESQTSTFLFL